MMPFLTSLFRRRVRILLTPQGATGMVLRGHHMDTPFSVQTPGELEARLETLPQLPLEILIDHPDLYFDPIPVPPIGRRDFEKLLQHRLDDLRETDLKTAVLPVGEGAPAPAQMVHLKRTGDFDPWFKVLGQAPQLIKGCTFLPLHLPTFLKTAGYEGLSLLVYPLPLGQVRHGICYGGNLLGSRLTDLPHSSSLANMVHHLEQEIYGSLSLLRKLMPQESKHATLILVGDEALKSLLASHAFPITQTQIFTKA